MTKVCKLRTGLLRSVVRFSTDLRRSSAKQRLGRDAPRIAPRIAPRNTPRNFSNSGHREERGSQGGVGMNQCCPLGNLPPRLEALQQEVVVLGCGEKLPARLLLFEKGVFFLAAITLGGCNGRVAFTDDCQKTPP